MPMMDTAIDPRQPNRFEKKTNTVKRSTRRRGPIWKKMSHESLHGASRADGGQPGQSI